MIHDILADCQIDTLISIEFSNRAYTGKIVQLDENRIKLITNDGRTVLLSARKLNSLIGYEVLQSVPEQAASAQESATPLVVSPRPAVSLPVPIAVPPSLPAVTPSQPTYLPPYDESVAQLIESPDYELSAEQFSFRYEKVDRYSVDEETYDLSKQLESLQAKYNYAINTTDWLERIKAIQQTLRVILANNYYNVDLRYNLALMCLALEEFDKGIKYLAETTMDKEDTDNLLLLAYLYVRSGEKAKGAEAFLTYSESLPFAVDRGFYLLNLVYQSGAYALLLRFFERFGEEEGFYSEVRQNDIVHYFLRLIGPENWGEAASKLSTASRLEKLAIIGNTAAEKHGSEAETSKKSNRQVLVANAEIYQYMLASGTGSIYYYDSKKRKFLANFSTKDVLEKEVRQRLNDRNVPLPIPVFCGITAVGSTGVTKKAVGIQLPKSVTLTMSAIKQNIAAEDFVSAHALLPEILTQFPAHEEAKDLLSGLPPLPVQVGTRETKRKKKKKKVSKGSYYHKADKARQKREWENAKKFLVLAIAHNQNKESAIKDLASIYNQENDTEKAIHLMETHLDEMSNKLASYNMLSHFYLTNGQYGKSVDLLHEVVAMSKEKKVGDMSILERRVAYCYYKGKDYRKAEKYLKEVLAKNPQDSIAKKWLGGLEEAKRTGEYQEDLFDEASVNILMTGISPLMLDALENCNYAGLTAKRIANEEFDKGALYKVREQIKKALGGKPRERAPYRLTEAKLIQLIDANDDRGIKEALAKYCYDEALSRMSLNHPADVIRYYYLEAFAMEEGWSFTLARQVHLFISSYCLRNEELLQENIYDYNMERLLSKGFERVYEMSRIPRYFWYEILEMSIANPVITAKIMRPIFGNEKVRASVVKFLTQPGIATVDIQGDPNRDKGTFTRLWNSARDQRKRANDNWFDKVDALCKASNLNSLVSIVGETYNQMDFPGLNDLDKNRYNAIKQGVISLVPDYINQSSFDEKERLSGMIIASIDRITEQINEQPTRFSYLGFSPLLQHFKELLEEHFSDVMHNSTPTVRLSVLDEVAAIENLLNIEVNIINTERKKAPIYDIQLEIMGSADFRLIGEPPMIYEAIRGGEQKEVQLALRVSDKILSQKTGDFSIRCTYKTRNADDAKELVTPQTIGLYNKAEFTEIDNIYRDFVESNAVKDEKMFKGRDSFIENIITTFSSSESKCVAIYGQKRSGKSSVLYHLKKRLNQRGQAFCVDFSMGSLITDFDVTSFFYKIFAEIENELEELCNTGVNVPDFQCPDIEYFEKYPVLRFESTMKKFLQSCRDTEGWADRKLTILIDEFTYLYNSIERGHISRDFMKTWKDIIDKAYFNSVLIGQDIMPKFMEEFANQFGVVEDVRLNYLAEEDAKELIVDPIRIHANDGDAKGENRYLGKTVEKIIDYTAGNPYYIQIFCYRLVTFMNNNFRRKVTELMVEEIARSLTEGKEALKRKQFDNLLTAGDADLESHPVEYTQKVLQELALASRNFGYSNRDTLTERIEDKEILTSLDDILDSLIRRQVISLRHGQYRIEVQLFQRWLIQNS